MPMEKNWHGAELILTNLRIYYRVNIVGNEVFIPQKRCDACPAGTRCVDNLCSGS